MTTEAFLVAAGAFIVSFLLTGLMKRLALLHGVLDVPNERSSHKVPTPRGGGLAIVIATVIALLVLAATGTLPRDLSYALAGGSLMVAIVGFLDDRQRLSARLRLAIHFAAAFWAVVWLGGLPALRFGEYVVTLGWFGYAVASLGVVWTLNLFNFMDGIDGIAASEAIFVAWVGAIMALLAGTSLAVPSVALSFGAACGGFLCWNWPPAKIFMGDAGSGFLGYTIAVLAIAVAREWPVALIVWVILGAIFFVDATVTLARRAARGEQVSEAHRTHAYQWLAMRWRSHRRVTLGALAINVVWLLPSALMATLYPRLAWCFFLFSLAPLVIISFVAGAGRSDATR